MIGAQTVVPDTAFESGIDLAIQENMSAVHRTLLYDLWDVAGLGGIGGGAARRLIEGLASHFAREEELMASVFALAQPESARALEAPEAEDIAVMTSFLESGFRDLREEHREFRTDILELKGVAEEAFDQRLYDLALRLSSHMATEEEVHFPSADFIGRCLMAGAGGACRA